MKGTTGFTLVEMAIVLVIVGLLLGGLLMPIATQVEQKRISETRASLEQIKEALIGFAAANGRLPCPATALTGGQESFAAGGSAANGLCSNFYDGFLPAAALGLTPSDGFGYAVDAWGLAQNRIRYAVYTGTINTILNPFTRTDGMRNATMNGIANFIATPSPLFSVCASATGITPTTCGAAVGNTLASNAPTVIYSVGKNAALPVGGTGADEGANPNPNGGTINPVFVSHEPTPSTAPNGEFDDIITWISVNTLFSRMIAAGALP